MFALISQHTDGYTYTSNETLCTFRNKALAELVAEELNKLERGYFFVEPVIVYEVESEAAVADIVAFLKKEFNL